MTAVPFRKSLPTKIAKGELGVYIAWGAFENYDGQTFTDAHGDRIPGAEFTAAALSLAKSGVLGHEHDSTVNGSVPLVMPMTEEIKAALELAGPHSGLIVGFEPTGEMAKSLDDGEVWELSIAGTAHVELVKAQIAKAAGEVAKAEHKRTLRGLSLKEISLVKRGAHGPGTRIAIAKAADVEPPTDAAPALELFVKNADAIRALLAQPVAVAKRTPALTSIDDGHQHLIADTDELDGCTSWDSAMSTSYGGHSHAWIKNPDGSIAIAVAAGHTHTVGNVAAVEKEHPTMPTDLEKSQTETIAKSEARITALGATVLAAAALPPDQAAFCKGKSLPEVEAFLGKSAAERATLATPVHKSVATGEVYFAGDPRIEIAKALDATHAELTKAREAGELAEIAKSAGALAAFGEPALLIVKAIRGHKLDADQQAKAMAQLTTSNASILTVTKHVGVGGDDAGGGDAWAVYSGKLAEFAKTLGKSPDDASPEFLADAKGKAAFAEYEAATKLAPRR